MGTIELFNVPETGCTIKLVDEPEGTLPQKEQHSTPVSNTNTVNNGEEHKIQLHNSARTHAGLEPLVNLPSLIKRLTVPVEIQTLNSRSDLYTITTINNNAAQ